MKPLFAILPLAATEAVKIPMNEILTVIKNSHPNRKVPLGLGRLFRIRLGWEAVRGLKHSQVAQGYSLNPVDQSRSSRVPRAVNRSLNRELRGLSLRAQSRKAMGRGHKAAVVDGAAKRLATTSYQFCLL